MKTNYVEMHKTLEERLTQLGSEIPGPMTGFARLHKKAVESRTRRALQSAQKYSLVANSVKSEIIIEPQIEVVVGKDGR